MPKKLGSNRPLKRVYYALNLENERTKARLRARRRKQTLSEEELQEQGEMHRLAQARYREKNRTLLRRKAWEYRHKGKWEKEFTGDTDAKRSLTVDPEMLRRAARD